MRPKFNPKWAITGLMPIPTKPANSTQPTDELGYGLPIAQPGDTKPSQVVRIDTEPHIPTSADESV